MALGTLLGPALADAGAGAVMPGADWLSIGSSVLGKAMQPSGKHSAADARLANEVANDFSGWNVNFGAGSIDSNRDQAAGGWGTYIALALVALVAVKLLKK